MAALQINPASYRDPSGFVFEQDGIIYRQVHQTYRQHYTQLMESGCYAALTQAGQLLPHRELQQNLTGMPEWFLTLQPELLAHISHPCEWSFGMLKDAALATLAIQQKAIGFGLSLKDATAWNFQLHKDRMCLIDTLSFETYDASKPWIAYRQFCENLLAPLLLMHYTKEPLQPLLLAWPEGIPLPVVSKWLSRKTRFNLHIALHIHLHAKMMGKSANAAARPVIFSKQKMQRMLSSLELLVQRLQMPARSGVWSHYYVEAGEREDYLTQKTALVKKWIADCGTVSTAIDLGANDGYFSKLLADTGAYTLAADFDAYCADELYKEVREKKITGLHPVVLDLAWPTPATGFPGGERNSFIQRSQSELGLALALVHHLAIGKNIPLEKIAYYFSRVCRQLLIEFVPKSDEKVQLMLQQREDIFTKYDTRGFEKAFERYFTIAAVQEIGNSGRILYRMNKHAE